jgi:hypothetical protein
MSGRLGAHTPQVGCSERKPMKKRCPQRKQVAISLMSHIFSQPISETAGLIKSIVPSPSLNQVQGQQGGIHDRVRIDALLCIELRPSARLAEVVDPERHQRSAEGAA